jgi:hypothetical protein
MRQTIKQVYMFSSDLYPYRPDDDPISDKLYIHFYRQLNNLIANFNECINAICLNNVIKLSDQFNVDKSKSIADALVNLLANCNKFFDDLNEDKNESSSSADHRIVVNNKYSDASVSKSNSSSVLNVIRVTRNEKISVKKPLTTDKKRKKIEYRSERTQTQRPLSARSDTSPSKVSCEFLQVIFISVFNFAKFFNKNLPIYFNFILKKRIRTARLFPGKQNETNKRNPTKSILNYRKMPLSKSL